MSRGGVTDVVSALGATVGTSTVNCPGAAGVTCTDGGFEAGVVPIAQGPISALADATEQDKLTVPVNPPADATSIEKVAVCPG